MEGLQHFVNDPTVTEALFCDDDVVFIRDWKTKFKTYPGIPFINASVGVNFSILPDGELRQLNNNGGCEAVWMTKPFAQFILNNVDARGGLDHVYFGLVRHAGLPLLCSPVAQQTSLLHSKRGRLPNTGEYQPELPWHEFVNSFKPTGLVYSELWNESGIARDDS
jgi:hypothetical protein